MEDDDIEQDGRVRAPPKVIHLTDNIDTEVRLFGKTWLTNLQCFEDQATPMPHHGLCNAKVTRAKVICSAELAISRSSPQKA